MVTPSTPPTELPATDSRNPIGDEETSPSKYFAQDYRQGQNVADFFQMKPQKYIHSVSRRDEAELATTPVSAPDSPQEPSPDTPTESNEPLSSTSGGLLDELIENEDKSQGEAGTKDDQNQETTTPSPGYEALTPPQVNTEELAQGRMDCDSQEEVQEVALSGQTDASVGIRLEEVMLPVPNPQVLPPVSNVLPQGNIVPASETSTQTPSRAVEEQAHTATTEPADNMSAFDRSTIAELKRANQRLMQMVRGSIEMSRTALDVMKSANPSPECTKIILLAEGIKKFDEISKIKDPQEWIVQIGSFIDMSAKNDADRDEYVSWLEGLFKSMSQSRRESYTPMWEDTVQNLLSATFSNDNLGGVTEEERILEWMKNSLKSVQGMMYNLKNMRLCNPAPHGTSKLATSSVARASLALCRAEQIVLDGKHQKMKSLIKVKNDLKEIIETFEEGMDQKEEKCAFRCQTKGKSNQFDDDDDSDDCLN